MGEITAQGLSSYPADHPIDERMSHATITSTPPHAQRGFSLFEVLVTVVVVSVGLLGLAGLQFAGLRASNNAQDATYAMQLAQDLADRIRANRVGALNGAYDPFSIDASTPEQNNPGCQATACDPTNIAQLDRYELHRRMYPDKYGVSNTPPILPKPSLLVATTGQAFTITVKWGDSQSLQLRMFVPGDWVP